jgi:hypothetical protein
MRYGFLAALLPAFLAAPSPHTYVHSDATPINSLAECPHRWSEVLDTVKPHTNPKTFFGTNASQSVARTRIDIPEFHDCQRLMTRPDRYGPLVAVFASDSLEFLTQKLSLQTDEVGPFTDKLREGKLPNGDEDAGVAAVQVVNTGLLRSGPYRPLGIEDGVSTYCIYLYSDGIGWEAWKLRTLETMCAPRVPRSRAKIEGDFLVVSTFRVPGYGGDAYPQVARWQYQDGQYFIGVKCGAAWCQIGSRRSTYTAFDPPFAARGVDGRQHRIKGWHDEQNLASVPTGLKPTTTWGVAVPDPALNSHDRIDDFSTWRRAGTVMINSDDYYEKLNFSKSVPGDITANTIEFRMRRVHQRDRGIYPRACNLREPSSLPPGIGTTIWEARITSATGRCRIYSMTRRTPADYQARPKAVEIDVIGTLRWRWKSNDETVWGKCGQACCEIDP